MALKCGMSIWCSYDDFFIYPFFNNIIMFIEDFLNPNRSTSENLV